MRSALIAAVCLACAASAPADVVQLQAQKDNTLYESPLGDLSNGAGPGMFCGKNGGGLTRRALLKFDVAASIPAGATINSVELTLNVSQTIAFDVAVGLHRTLADWGEGTSLSVQFGGGGGAPATPGDATWVHTFYSNQLWTTIGGDYNPVASATHQVGAIGPHTWASTAGLVADVQSWLDSPATNFGWTIVGDESAIATAKRCDTREHPMPANRPLLVIDYTPACYADCNASGGLTIADFACFQAKFVAGDPYADCNSSGGLTIADFACFQAAFVGGCP